MLIHSKVCSSLPSLPQRRQWVTNLFGGSEENFKKFVDLQKRPRTWTDDAGIMCQVIYTALTE